MPGQEEIESEEVVETVDRDTPPEDMTDEQLDAFLSDAEAGTHETAESLKEDSEPEPEEEVEAKTEEPPQEDTPEEEPEADPQARQIADKQKMIDKQSNEIGELRKRLEKVENGKEEESDVKDDLAYEDLLEDPAKLEGFIDKKIEARESKEREALRIEEEKFETMIRENKDYVSEKVPDFKELLDDIGEIAKEDGHTKEQIVEFKKSPYQTDPAILIQLSERARLRQKIAKLENKPKNMLDRIERGTKSSKGVPAQSGQSGRLSDNDMPVSREQISTLSDSDLDNLLNSRIKKGL